MPQQAKVNPNPVPLRKPAFDVVATATIHTLAEHGCRWPIGEPNEDDFGFCGRHRSGHPSYCDGHAPMSSDGKGQPIRLRREPIPQTTFYDSP
jgi:hypothetical protein